MYHIFTPTTTNFDLGAVTTYKSSHTGHELVVSSHEFIQISEGLMDNIPNQHVAPYTSHQLVHVCHNLQHLQLDNDPRVKVVFEMDAPTPSPIPILSTRSELATIRDHTQQPPPPPHYDDLLSPLLLPAHHHLKSIELESLKEMSHVWKCNNWNKFSIPPFDHHPLKLEFPFHNLTDINLESCHKVKYLFSPLMAKFLSNLKSIRINRCNGMEEVISRRDDENIMCVASTTTSSHTTNTTLYFPHLDTLTLWSLPCLKRIDDEIQNGGDEAAVVVTKYITTHHHYHHVPQLSNLKLVYIWGCDLLPHVFTFSTLQTLNQLKYLSVSDCKALTQVIIDTPVKQEEEDELFNGMTYSSSSSSSSKGAGAGVERVVVVFPRLETLVLKNLPKLKGFFLGINNIHFRWPLLEYLIIENCPEMSVFTSPSCHSETPKLKYIYTHLGKHILDEEVGLNFHGSTDETSMNQLQDDHQQLQSTLFPSSDPTIPKGMPWSFHNLKEIQIGWLKEFQIGWRNDDEKIIPCTVLLQLQELEKVDLRGYSKVKEIFEVGSPEEGTSSESQTVVKIPNLTQMKLESLKSLEYIWKSNQWMKLEFPNLTTVSIVKCPELKHVFTCSMVGSLVHLQYLSISDCKKIDVIIKEEEEGGGDAKENEIVLSCLKSIKLEKLPRLLGLCLKNEAFSLPSLDTLEIDECPEIMVFTNGHLGTPQLKVIDTPLGMFCVRNNLNFVIRTRQEEEMFGATVDMESM